MGNSLNRLSEREERLLRLLAEGHTIKSAAHLTGDSENAANELLRSARRKLGVTSSREAARMLMADRPEGQKSCDNKTVLFDAPRNHQPWRRLIVGGSMFASLAIAAFVVFGLGSGTAGDLPAQPVATSLDNGAPKVVSTSPAQGEQIVAGEFALSVTYDRPMAPNSMSFATGPNPAFPQCDGKPVQSADGKTYAMQCRAEAGEEYTVWFNYGQFRGFRSAQTGRAAEPYGIAFSARN